MLFTAMTTETAQQKRSSRAHLPYAYDALAPHVSEETLHYHHDKHYEGYVAKLNELLADSALAGRPRGRDRRCVRRSAFQ